MDHETDFKWSIQGGGRLKELEYHYNGPLGTQKARSIQGNGRSVEVVSQRGFTVYIYIIYTSICTIYICYVKRIIQVCIIGEQCIIIPPKQCIHLCIRVHARAALASASLINSVVFQFDVSTTAVALALVMRQRSCPVESPVQSLNESKDASQADQCNASIDANAQVDTLIYADCTTSGTTL